MTTKDRILLESKAWRLEKISLDKNYFARLDAMHNPKILWISSSDSLASIRDMTNTEPGDIIVYQNVAAQVRQDDISMMAILEDALEVCQVSHIIICGYSHCTGIRDVILGADDRPAVKEWLRNLRTLYERHREQLRDLPFEEQEKILSELNIREQVNNLGAIPSIQRAWEKTDFPQIYGWYFDLATGTLKEVFSLEKNHRIKQLSTLVENGSLAKSMAS
jgi:carbonic anhydrase